MIKTLTIIVAVLAVALAAVLGYAATKPDSFRVQRTVTIKAAPEKIIALIDNFHNWTEWSPYEKRDPAMKRSYSGADSGKGAVYAWEGSSDVGSGRMEITELSPAAKVAIKLDFIKPFEGHNTAEFTVAPQGDSNTVTWAMYGPSPFISKVMGLFFDMDHMIGKDFETGLANLKTIAEK